MGIPFVGLWCLGTVAGAEEGRVGPWGHGQPAPLELWAQILPHQLPGQILCREALGGVGHCLCEKYQKKILKGKLKCPFPEVWVVFVTTCAWH